MTPAVDEARRWRLLGEMGVVRYRLRGGMLLSPVADGAPAASLAATDVAIADASSARPPGMDVVLTLDVPGLVAAPSAGVEGIIWRQVRDWLQISDDAIAWRRDPGAIALPPVQTWASADGKRDLWRALKAYARPVR